MRSRTSLGLLGATAVVLGLFSACSPEAEPAPLSPPAVSGEPVSSCSPEPEAGTLPESFWGLHAFDPIGDGFPAARIGSINLTTAQTYWTQIETAPAEYDFSRLDEIVETAEARGARPVLVMGFTPSFHADDPDDPVARTTMPDLDAWRAWVTTVSERYRDQLDYQVWPEPNIIGNWTGTPAQMAELTIEASRIIRDTAPGATIIAPATTLRLEGQRDWMDDYWATDVDGERAGDHVDAVAVDPFPLTEGGPVEGVELLCEARDILTDNGVDLPLWTNEINYGVPSGGNATNAPKYAPVPAAASVIQTYLLHAAEGVERVFWLGWFTTPGMAVDLADEEGRATPAGRTFTTLREWLEESSRPACAVRGSVFECAVTTPDEVRRVLWTDGGKATEPVPEDADRIEQLNGSVREIPDDGLVEFGRLPIAVVTER